MINMLFSSRATICNDKYNTMIGSWLQQQSIRVLISKRVQNRCLVQCSKRRLHLQCCKQRSIIVTSCSSQATDPRHHQQLHPIQQYNRHYGSQLKVELDPNPESMIASPALKSYLRHCLSYAPGIHKPIDMEFAIAFLGTGSGAPTMHRNGSCTALRLGGQTYLFDVCEGTFRQLQFTRISPISITKIFVSHLHGDHLFGIVPVIMGIMVAHKVQMTAVHTHQTNKQKKKKMMKKMDRRLMGEESGGEDSVTMEKPTLEIYGPPGLYNYIGMVLSLSCSKMNYMNIKVIELVGGKEERGMNPGGYRHKPARRNVFTAHYPEIKNPLITRKFLEQSDDKTWIIDSPEPINTDTPATVDDAGFARLPNDTNLGSERRMHIKAAELDHLDGVQTFGYVVEEQPPPGTIDKDKAVALGVRPSRKYGLLKCGISVPNDDETAVVHPSQVLSQTFRPRKFTLLADHRMVPPPMARLSANSDIVVHEATLLRKDGLARIKARGHQNAYNAGRFAHLSGCKVLALNHFAGTAFGEEKMPPILEEAREGNRGASEILAAYDFMEVFVPRGGFDFDKKEESSDDGQDLVHTFSHSTE